MSNQPNKITFASIPSNMEQYNDGWGIKKVTMKKYVWLNIKTGEFSNSWDDELMKILGGVESVVANMKENTIDGFKLIEYTCLNDENFVFTKQMKLK